jgi:2-polyprenyl-3-methyl-5-hydroxy-6-metoxy-1,4-benzoquinol methylase
MKTYFEQTDYTYEPVTKIWIRSGYSGIAYSDGDEVEQRISSIISHASDLTIFSAELRQHCTDWASLYHLSGMRANILRPLKHILSGDVLEVGAGCGAITRYLGECAANVLALEGSPRRAVVARSRTRDLENVTVLAEKFEQFEAKKKFDVITLIGVLEYANLFTTGEDPALSMLERVRSLLKPKGKLIIAIENQLGLKYFAGAPEDHLGQPMYGI